MGKDQPISVYKPATFYTVERDNAYPYPLDGIPHLLLTGRYSRSDYTEKRNSLPTHLRAQSTRHKGGSTSLPYLRRTRDTEAHRHRAKDGQLR